MTSVRHSAQPQPEPRSPSGGKGALLTLAKPDSQTSSSQQPPEPHATQTTPASPGLFAKLGTQLCRKPIAWAVVAICLCAAAVATTAASQLQQEDDLLAFLPADDPDVRHFQALSQTFGGLRVALVGLEPAAVFDPNFLTRLQNATQSLDRLPSVDQVLSLTNVLDFVPDPQTGGIITGPLFDQVPASSEGLNQLRNRIMSRDHVVGNFISPNGSAVLLYAFLTADSDARASAEAIRAAVQQHFPNTPTYWGGAPFASAYIFETTQQDLHDLTPWAVLCMLAIMLIAFRDPLGTVIAVIATAMGAVGSLGLMAAMGEPMNLAIGSMPVVLFAIGSAYSVHVLAAFYDLRRTLSTGPAVAATLARVGPTLTAAGLTTVASLLSFLAMDLRPMRIFGLYTAVGVFLTLVLALTFVPAVMRVLPHRTRRQSRSTQPQGDACEPRYDEPSPRGFLGRTLVPALAVLQRRKAVSMAVLMAVAAIAVSLSGQVRTAVDSSNFFSPGSPPSRAQAFLRTHFGGATVMQLHTHGSLERPEVLRELAWVADNLGQLPGVHSATHISDVIGRVQEAMGGQRRIPHHPDAVRLLFALLSGDPSIAQLANNDHTDALTQIKLTTQGADSTAHTLAQAEAWLAEHTQADYTIVSRRGPHQAAAQARLQTLVLDRIAAAAHGLGVPLQPAQQSWLADHLHDAAAVAPSTQAVAAELSRFLRSDESPVPLPTGTAEANGAGINPNDLAHHLGMAIAALGPAPSSEALRRHIAATIADHTEGSAADPHVLAEDLEWGLEGVLPTVWESTQSQARAQALQTGLAKLASTEATQTKLKHAAFAASIAAALPTLDAPTVLLPTSTVPNLSIARAELGNSPSGAIPPMRLPLQFKLSGEPVIHRALARSAANNQTQSLAVALGLVLAIMTALFRSLRVGLLVAAPTALTLALIYAGMTLLDVRLDIGTAMLASIILGAGVDYAVHFVAAWRAPTAAPSPQSEAAGNTQPQASENRPRASLQAALHAAMAHTGPAIVTNAVMVCAGFAMLTLGEARPLQHVGGLTAAAMLVAAIATFVVVPVLARQPSYLNKGKGKP